MYDLKVQLYKGTYMTALSLIIPIYKTEAYILECIESILPQIIDNDVEVICINDGSPDKAMNILKSLVETLEPSIRQKFVLFDQINKGVSEARNRGLDLSQGEYIAFIDSDDKINESYIKTILKCIIENKPDLIDFNLITSKGSIVYARKGDVFSINSVFRAAAWYNCSRVIRKSLIDIRFIPEIYYEDFAFFPTLYINAKKTIYIDSSLYWYRVNDKGITMSLTQQGNSRTIESLETVLIYFIELYVNSRNSYYAIVIVQSYFLLSVNVCRRLGFRESLLYIKKYKEKINFLKLELIDDAIDSKTKYFYIYPNAYLMLYNIYCNLKSIKTEFN